MLHNETTNIWSHLYGVFIYLFLVVYMIFWTAPDASLNLSDEDTILFLSVGSIKTLNRFIAKHILWIESDVTMTMEVTKFPMIVHLIGCITCMSLSSIYHLFCCHSERAMCRLYKYDYAGVSIMIACSIYPPYNYPMMCDPTVFLGYIYTSIINISSLVLVIVWVHPKFDNAKYRKLRTVLYWIVGISWGVPGFHYLFTSYPTVSYCNLYLWALGGVFFVFGAFVYFKRFPESKYPGRFDIFGQSHNIWHFFVLLGGITHFFASLANYYGRRIQQCPIDI